MKLIQIAFSPTGGVRKAADIMTQEWEGSVLCADLTDANEDFSAVEIGKEDLALIAVPSFGGRVPALAAERLARIRGNGANCVLLCVYGNRAFDDALIELQDLAEKCGFTVAAAVAAVAEHSIVRKYAAGRPDDADAKELRSFAQTIFARIAQSNKLPAPGIPGNRPYKKAAGAGLVPKATKDCTRCGVCAEKCPAQAIDAENPKTADAKKCVSCMRCIAVCPNSARKANRAVVSVVSAALQKACASRKDNELFL